MSVRKRFSSFREGSFKVREEEKWRSREETTFQQSGSQTCSEASNLNHVWVKVGKLTEFFETRWAQ